MLSFDLSRIRRQQPLDDAQANLESSSAVLRHSGSLQDQIRGICFQNPNSRCLMQTRSIGKKPTDAPIEAKASVISYINPRCDDGADPIMWMEYNFTDIHNGLEIALCSKTEYFFRRNEKPCQRFRSKKIFARGVVLNQSATGALFASTIGTERWHFVDFETNHRTRWSMQTDFEQKPLFACRADAPNLFWACNEQSILKIDGRQKHIVAQEMAMRHNMPSTVLRVQENHVIVHDKYNLTMQLFDVRNMREQQPLFATSDCIAATWLPTTSRFAHCSSQGGVMKFAFVSPCGLESDFFAMPKLNCSHVVDLEFSRDGKTALALVIKRMKRDEPRTVHLYTCSVQSGVNATKHAENSRWQRFDSKHCESLDAFSLQVDSRVAPSGQSVALLTQDEMLSSFHFGHSNTRRPKRKFLQTDACTAKVNNLFIR